MAGIVEPARPVVRPLGRQLPDERHVILREAGLADVEWRDADLRHAVA